MCNDLNRFIYVLVCISSVICSCLCKGDTPVCHWDVSGHYPKVIDLKAVLNDNDNRTFTTITTFNNSSLRFYYNPCYYLNNVSDICSRSALCVEHIDTSMYQDIGDFDNVRLYSDYADGYIRIHYKASQKTAQYDQGSTIIMTCSESNSPLFKFKTDNGEVYIFTMASRRFCRINISTGTIMCLTFLSFLMSYLVVGMLYKRAVLGASGIDLIPNISFWTTLPGLIKDGYLFFISPCTGSRSEYDAYERI